MVRAHGRRLGADHDHSGPGEGGASLSPADAFNSELDDGVDYLDPRWLARTDAVIIYTRFNTLDGMAVSTSGSGTVKLNLARVTVQTGTTSGSDAKLEDRSLTYVGSGGLISWQKEHTVNIALGVKSRASDGVAEFITGNRSSAEYYGLRYDGASGDLLLVSSSGGTESTATVASGYGDGEESAQFEHVPGTSVSVGLSSGSSAEVTSNVPNSGGFGRNMTPYVSNESVGENMRLDLYDYRMVAKP